MITETLTECSGKVVVVRDKSQIERELRELLEIFQSRYISSLCPSTGLIPVANLRTSRPSYHGQTQ